MSQLLTAEEIQGLPVKRYRIDGAPGVWIRCGKISHAVRAKFNGRRYWHSRDTLIEREVLWAMGVERPEFSVPREQ